MTPTDHDATMNRSTLDDIFVREAYCLLSSCGTGIHKANGELLIRPAEARLVLSKLRISKPIIRRILGNMERQGLVVVGNQFVAIKKGRKAVTEA